MASESQFDLKRVVVVDDDPEMLKTLTRILRSHDLRPVPISDPETALAEVLEHPPGVLMVDLVMPSMSGLDLVTRLRTELGQACPPVVLVSSSCHDLAPMEQIMFDALYSKPFSVDALVRTVRRLARSHHERRVAASGVQSKRGFEPSDEDLGSI